MDTEQLKLDVAAGTIDVDRLVGLIASQQKLIVGQQKLIVGQQKLIVGHEAEIEALKKQVEELKQQIEKNPTPRLDEAYSEKAEEDRQAKAQGKPKPRKKPKRPGIALPRAHHQQPPATAADPSPHFTLRTESTATFAGRK